jgi:hypothetical protein
MQLNSTDLAISTFELLVKSINPLMGQPAELALTQRVMQGYSLTISNLESVDLSFRLEFRTSYADPMDQQHTLFNNADLVCQIAGSNLLVELTGNADNTLFGSSFQIPAGQTAHLHLMPKPNPELEVRGYVVLRLPALRSNFGFIFESQAAHPVKVLLNAETRGTLLPRDWPTTPMGDSQPFNQTLPLASGRALNEVTPEPGRFIILEAQPAGIRNSVLNGLTEQPSLNESPDMYELAGILRNPKSKQHMASASAATSLLD